MKSFIFLFSVFFGVASSFLPTEAQAFCDGVDRSMHRWNETLAVNPNTVAEANNKESRTWYFKDSELTVTHELTDLFGPYAQVQTLYRSEFDRANCTLTLKPLHTIHTAYSGYQSPHQVVSEKTISFEATEPAIVFTVEDHLDSSAIDLTNKSNQAKTELTLEKTP